MNRFYNILIVDDDIDNAQSLGELFELEGHTVSLAHSGVEAIAAYLAGDFDVAFMDVMMPDKNGVESFLEIRRLRPAAKVIMMTGFSVEQLLQRAVENGAMGVLTKPMEPQRVLKMLDEVGPRGVVVATTGIDHAAENVHQTLLAAGRACRLIREARWLAVEPPRAADGVLIFDTKRPLIESIAHLSRLQGKLNGAQVIFMVGDKKIVADPEDILRDFAVTGVLNKPFDPMLLLDKLNIIAA